MKVSLNESREEEAEKRWTIEVRGRVFVRESEGEGEERDRERNHEKIQWRK